jgi:hypothetical protein
VAASYLSFGADQVRHRLWARLVDEAAATAASAEEADQGDVMVSNPCAFVGQVSPWQGRYQLVGTGDAAACEELTRAVLFADCVDTDTFAAAAAATGLQRPTGRVGGGDLGECALGAGLPPVEGVDFVAMSVYFFAADCVRAFGQADLEAHPAHGAFAAHWPSPTLNHLRAAAAPFCALPWADVDARQGLHEWTWESQMPNRCFEAVLVATLLRDGFGIAPDARAVTFAVTLGDASMEVEWTLGFALASAA